MIIIYGAGEYGQKLNRILSNLGVSISYYCQTKTNKYELIDGIEVISFEKLNEFRGEKCVIIIAIRDNDLCNMIKNKILSVYSCDFKIIFGNSFVEDNYNVFDNDSYYCVLCGNSIKEYITLKRKESDLFKNHYVIGGGYRKNGLCPICGSKDRERWCLFVLSNYTNIFTAQCNVLHFAPELGLSKHIIANEKCEYYSGDLQRGLGQHVSDVYNIQYRDSFFDYIIMNHVFEHIGNEELAFMELRRVLKSKGKLIFSVPICMDFPTREGSIEDSEKERFEKYGQWDHVRLYGNDYKDRFEKFGLKVTIYTPKEIIGSDLIEKYGFIDDDVVLIGEYL